LNQLINKMCTLLIKANAVMCCISLASEASLTWWFDYVCIRLW